MNGLQRNRGNAQGAKGHRSIGSDAPLITSRSVKVLGNLVHQFGCIDSKRLEDCGDRPLVTIFHVTTFCPVPLADTDEIQ